MWTDFIRTGFFLVKIVVIFKGAEFPEHNPHLSAKIQIVEAKNSKEEEKIESIM